MKVYRASTRPPAIEASGPPFRRPSNADEHLEPIRSGASRAGRPQGVADVLELWRIRGSAPSIEADGSEVAIDLAARMEFVDDRHVTIHLALAGRVSASEGAGAGPADVLTARERAVITLIAMGRETQEIAETLYVSLSTVRTHVRNAMAKVGAHTRAQLVAVVMGAEAHAGVAHAEDSGGGQIARLMLVQTPRGDVLNEHDRKPVV
jgi:DNA-binding CsgD family transcriptional regulator